MGAETGKLHESPKPRASELVCELRRVDMDICRLRPHRRVMNRVLNVDAASFLHKFYTLIILQRW